MKDGTLEENRICHEWHVYSKTMTCWKNQNINAFEGKSPNPGTCSNFWYIGVHLDSSGVTSTFMRGFPDLSFIYVVLGFKSLVFTLFSSLKTSLTPGKVELFAVHCQDISMVMVVASVEQINMFSSTTRRMI